MTLLTLPHELVERILLLLTTESVQTCKLVNRPLNEIIQSSALLQYSHACEVAGVIDNPRSPLSYAERLEALNKREDAWRTLKPVFEKTIKVNHQPSSLYGLTEGAFFLGDHSKKDLHYCQLPFSPQDDPRWIKIPGHGTEEGSVPGDFVNFATSIYEHDLLVKAISSEIWNDVDAVLQYSLDLVLLKFSTGEHHPLARQPRIHVQTSRNARFFVSPGIVGDNLALVVHSGEDDTCPDKLFIFDWKTGHKRLEHEAIDNPYLEFAFISPDLLLVPNLAFALFEVWHLPLDPKPPIQLLSLKLPSVSSDYSPINISCDGEPNPILHSMPYFPSRPFFPSPESSLIIANVYLSSVSPLTRFQRASYTLIMHRRALLDTIQKWILEHLESEELDHIEVWFTNGVTVHEIADPDDGSVTRLGAHSKLIRVCSGYPSTSITTSHYNIPRVKWADWGPPISRWFLVNESQARWIVNSFGQRYAFSDSDGTVSVADFNPHNLRRNGDKEGEGFERLCDNDVFSEAVYMGLKCVVWHAPDEYDFDAVLMDGERLLGLKLNREGRHEYVKVLYFG